MEIPRGFHLKPNFLKESMTLKWNFQRGGGFKLKNLPREGVWIFSGTTHWLYFVNVINNGN